MDRIYKRYEIQERKYASNIVIGIYDFIDENGKLKEKYDKLFCCFLSKKIADNYIKDWNSSLSGSLQNKK